MQKICRNCHFIGEPKRQSDISYFGIACTALLGLIFLILGFWHPLFIIGTYLSIFSCLLLLSDCFNSYNICPNCKEKTLIPANPDKARILFNEYSPSIEHIPQSLLDKLEVYEYIKDEKRVLCTRCTNTGAGIIEGLCHPSIGIIVLLLGLISIPLAYLNPLSLVGSFIYLIFGITMVLSCFIESRVCGTCKTETMIPLNTPKAKLLIAEQHLDIDEDDAILDPPMFHYRYGLYILFLSWILLGFFIYLLYDYFSTL